MMVTTLSWNKINSTVTIQTKQQERQINTHVIQKFSSKQNLTMCTY